MSLLLVTAHLAAPVASRGEPPHLDALLAAAAARCQSLPPIDRETPAGEITDLRLPLARLHWRDEWVWMASRACPSDAQRGTSHITRRPDSEDIDRRARRWNVAAGPERSQLVTVPLLVSQRLTWLAVGARRGVIDLLRYVGHVGSIRRHGYGRVRRWDVISLCDHDDPTAILHLDGRANRHLPRSWCRETHGYDIGPVRAPYWHPGRDVARVRAGIQCDLYPEILARAMRFS